MEKCRAGDNDALSTTKGAFLAGLNVCQTPPASELFPEKSHIRIDHSRKILYF